MRAGRVVYRHYLIASAVLVLSIQPAQADKLVRFAGGGTAENNVPATRAKLVQPFGVDFDRAGNLYVVELQGGRVLKVDTKGTFTILAGTGMKGDAGDGGPALMATFNGMHSLAVAPDGTIYLADTWNNRVRKIDPIGKITAFAGTGKKASRVEDGPAASRSRRHLLHCLQCRFQQALFD